MKRQWIHLFGAIIAATGSSFAIFRPMVAAEEPLKSAEVQPESKNTADEGADSKVAEKAKEIVEAVEETVESAIRNSAEAYCEAFCEHDSQKVALQFTENAEYVQADGEVLRGREEIEASLKQCFEAGHDCRLELSINSISFPSSIIAIEDGTSYMIHGDHETPIEYTAVHVKDASGWKIASVREKVASHTHPHREMLGKLDWLMGDWVDESHDAQVSFHCKPTDDGHFLVRDFRVHMNGEIALTGTQRIGWDPVGRKFRVWYFDSQGGFGEGNLTQRDDDHWILKLSGTTAEGDAATGTFDYEIVNGHTVRWSAQEYVVGSERSDEQDVVTLVRQSPVPRATESAKADPDAPHPAHKDAKE